MKYVIALLLWLPLTLSGAQSVVKGTTKILTFSKIPADATLTFGNKSIPILQHPSDTSKRIALIPVNYRSHPGLKTVRITYTGGQKTVELNITQANYTSETITVASSKVTPNKTQRERTAREYHDAMKIYGTFTKKRYWNQPFIAPMDSHITSQFGTARMYNNTLKSYHSGTDFRAAMRTPIHATNDGVVVIAKDRYYAGNSIVIDHGEGIYSCYYHLSALHVKKGDIVKQGVVIGLSGRSGRVTGPHLHYAMMVHGTQVDPLKFHQAINHLFEHVPQAQ